MSGDIADLDGDEAIMRQGLEERFGDVDHLLPPGQAIDEQIATRARVKRQEEHERKQAEEREALECITIAELRDWLNTLSPEQDNKKIVAFGAYESITIKGIEVDEYLNMSDSPIPIAQPTLYKKFGDVK